MKKAAHRCTAYIIDAKCINSAKNSLCPLRIDSLAPLPLFHRLRWLLGWLLAVFVLHSEIVHDKRLHVGILINHLGNRLAVTVACFAIDAYDFGGIARA